MKEKVGKNKKGFSYVFEDVRTFLSYLLFQECDFVAVIHTVLGDDKRTIT
jgi:hypothetical protein